ncbi:hypothetical protein LCGC14_1991970 [marine sediment metagenome]|uniref:Uncharacterized protein n=1 Tax=marine sediment metagenome TaxID=412755 RepID=A0A0F9I2Y2_9ZZZZ
MPPENEPPIEIYLPDDSTLGVERRGDTRSGPLYFKGHTRVDSTPEGSYVYTWEGTVSFTPPPGSRMYEQPGGAWGASPFVLPRHGLRFGVVRTDGRLRILGHVDIQPDGTVMLAGVPEQETFIDIPR